MLLEADSGQTLLIDCGADARFSLHEQGLSFPDIKNIFISHLHSDHVGGLEWLAFTKKFQSNGQKPTLYICKALADDLWDHVLSGGLKSIAGETSLKTYFNVVDIPEDSFFTWEGVKIRTVPTLHCQYGDGNMPTYGIFFTANGIKVWISGDTQFKPDKLMKYYEEADVIFHDCDIVSKGSSPVHSSYHDLSTLPPKIKNKMWLYHYQPGPLPNAAKEGFRGFVKKGQRFDFSNPRTLLP